ncbi:transposon Ty3-G Gag-Pol polyprotein [Trichonephila clavipes]|nr:transposon Ty3-G Gag-Pol polyprotein [Trichonephila clavipes]
MKSRWGGDFCGRNVPILQTGTASHLNSKIKRLFIVQAKTVRRESSYRTPVSDKDLYLTIPSGHCMHSYRQATIFAAGTPIGAKNVELSAIPISLQSIMNFLKHNLKNLVGSIKDGGGSVLEWGYKSATELDTIYYKILKEFPSITKLPNPNQPMKHNTIHYIITKCPPVVAKSRKLAPDRLKIAKTKFQNMMHLGHLRLSKSNYASPLHMVPKKGTLDLRPVGDYRALNSQTLKDKYPIPCIADFTAELYSSRKFLVESI